MKTRKMGCFVPLKKKEKTFRFVVTYGSRPDSHLFLSFSLVCGTILVMRAEILQMRRSYVFSKIEPLNLCVTAYMFNRNTKRQFDENVTRDISIFATCFLKFSRTFKISDSLARFQLNSISHCSRTRKESWIIAASCNNYTRRNYILINIL